MIERKPPFVLLDDLQLEENFLLSEFLCKVGFELKLDMRLPNMLQLLRNKADKPIMISSGYRTPEYNLSINGSPNSQHLLGRAADIWVPGFSAYTIAKMAIAIGFKGVGIYDTFTHVDVRTELHNTVGRKYDFWDYRSKGGR